MRSVTVSSSMAIRLRSCSCSAQFSGDTANALRDFLAVEHLLPVIAHQARLAEFDRLVARIGECAGNLVEDDRAENVHVTEQEVARAVLRDAALDHFVHS